MNRDTGSRKAAPGGFTLVEMMVVMTLLAAAAGVAAMSLGSARSVETQGQLLDWARDSAARYGIPVTAPLDSSPESAVLLVLPDGRMIGAGSELMSDAPDKPTR